MNIGLRFITDGIRETLDHYRRDDLPPHRLSWELSRRIDALGPHDPSAWIAQLRDLQRRIAEVHSRGQRTGLTEVESSTINDSLRQLQLAPERVDP